ncbi:MAG: hypothetical protein AAFX99_07290 [Myxococcota bacterium]
MTQRLQALRTMDPCAAEEDAFGPLGPQEEDAYPQKATELEQLLHVVASSLDMDWMFSWHGFLEYRLDGDEDLCSDPYAAAEILSEYRWCSYSVSGDIDTATLRPNTTPSSVAQAQFNACIPTDPLDIQRFVEAQWLNQLQELGCHFTLEFDPDPEICSPSSEIDQAVAQAFAWMEQRYFAQRYMEPGHLGRRALDALRATDLPTAREALEALLGWISSLEAFTWVNVTLPHTSHPISTTALHAHIQEYLFAVQRTLSDQGDLRASRDLLTHTTPDRAIQHQLARRIILATEEEVLFQHGLGSLLRPDDLLEQLCILRPLRLNAPIEVDLEWYGALASLWACDCAERAVAHHHHLGEPWPLALFIETLATIRDYVWGETSLETLDTARTQMLVKANADGVPTPIIRLAAVVAAACTDPDLDDTVAHCARLAATLADDPRSERVWQYQRLIDYVTGAWEAHLP